MNLGRRGGSFAAFRVIMATGLISSFWRSFVAYHMIGHGMASREVTEHTYIFWVVGYFAHTLYYRGRPSWCCLVGCGWLVAATMGFTGYAFGMTRGMMAHITSGSLFSGYEEYSTVLRQISDANSRL